MRSLSDATFLVLRVLRAAAIGLVWLALIGLTAWAAAALYVDLPIKDAGLPAAVVYLATIAAALILIPGAPRKAAACVIGFAAVLAWWLTLAPSNDRAWQGDVTEEPWAEIAGDTVTIRNVRNYDYRSEFDYTPHWETRTYNLNDIRGADLFITFWGSPWIAHPNVSFQFGDNDHVAFSVETRKEEGEEYSAVRGFFRQYELIYIVADERDVIRLRTNYRVGEEVYLYRTTASPEASRAIFLSYIESANALHDKPAFYNAITSNCTTNIRIHTKAVAGAKMPPWDWRLLLNGKSDEFAYQNGRLAGDLPFDQLKQQAHINDAARAAGQSEQFSRLIREGRAGFGKDQGAN
jgi:hypothetical protein